MTTKALSRPVTSIPALFEDFFKPLDTWLDYTGTVSKMTTIPAVNIVELPKEFKVSLAVPGMKKEDFTIDVEDDMITISSQNEENKEVKDEKYTRKEYNYSSFSRSFTLPENVKQDAIEAVYTDGVLQLVLPKKAEAKATVATRKIPIK
ncbi:Hsp20/alpha crystallin family protein [Chitinophagaceae bacterium LB-8]|uniref:Hsp20/alpha crystallin family protein n=1 Tax=Paraflavisolibacter caeni TaxID=2982496 RepID=A0A9X2XZ49_9BACT|nr:Hsp20/alpha crystallin family protein [Paraflavisolibacter caeni]MCU7551566.1 Hsp20/alpha crystallin family protein [Paraflavisolibacter caeni]